MCILRVYFFWKEGLVFSPNRFGGGVSDPAVGTSERLWRRTDRAFEF